MPPAGLSGSSRRVTPTGSLRLAEHAPIDSLPGFNEGAWWVQDAAAALPAKLLGDVRGKRVLDLCAAPGGKTLQLAAAGAHVTAVDKSEARLKRLRENLARTQTGSRSDLRRRAPFQQPNPSTPSCSTRPAPPPVRCAVTQMSLGCAAPPTCKALADLQAQLIDAAAKLLKPGAPLVYAVCSLEPEEGPGVVAAASAQWLDARAAHQRSPRRIHHRRRRSAHASRPMARNRRPRRLLRRPFAAQLSANATRSPCAPSPARGTTNHGADAHFTFDPGCGFRKTWRGSARG